MNSPEDLFKNAFENFESAPPEDAWSNISREVAFKSFFKFYPKRLNIYYTAAAIAVLSTALYFGTADRNTEPITISSIKESANTISASQRKVIIKDIPVQRGNGSSLASDNNRIQVIDNNNFAQPTTETCYDTEVNIQYIDESQLVEDNSEPKVDMDFSADFVAEIPDACSPSTVRFVNRSKNVDYCVWNFGNGSTSYDYNATASYRAAGTYYVTLKTVKGTKSKVSAQTVTINPMPKADIAHTKARVNSPMIVEARNVQDASHIKWLFGDDASSVSTKAAHTYKSAGNFTLSLIVSNQFCADTINESIEVTVPEYSISFPNALYASVSGATDGFGGGQPKFAPFLPKGDINMIDRYSLRIYSKAGKEVFSSNNPSFGWNGYYNGGKLSAGVYVYKAAYTFVNGEYYTSEGNITLIYGE